MSPTPAFQRRCLSLAILALGLLTAFPLAGQDRRERKEPSLVPPPQPIPQEIKVERGEDIVIPLRIYGRRNQHLTYLIRKPPKGGQLSGLKNTEAEAAIVHYRSNWDRSITRDSFEYAVKSVEGVSAPVVVQIEIIDQPPNLAGPAEVSFSNLLIATEETQTVEFINHGGMVAEGTCHVSGSWRLDSPAEYRIDPGGRLFVKVTFTPERAGDFLGELRLTSQPDRTTLLRGSAQTPLEINPPVLRLTTEPVTQVRAGVFELTNHTETDLEVRFDGGERLRTDEGVRVAPRQTVAVMVRTEPRDAEPISALLKVSAGPHTAQLAVVAAPLPAIIRPAERTLDLGFVASSGTASGKLVLRNEGGIAGTASLTAQPPFRVAAQPIEISAGQSVEVTVWVDGYAMGTFEKTLQLQTPGGTIEVPARVIVGNVDSHRPRPTRSTPELSPNAAPTIAPLPLTVHDLDLEKPIDGKKIVRSVLLEPHRCIIEWHADLVPATRFVADVRELTMEGGQFSVRWKRLATFEYERVGDHFRGTFQPLEPGRRQTIRVLTLTPGGALGPQVLQTTVDTPHKKGLRGPKISLLGVLALLGAGLVGYCLWLRFKPLLARPVPLKKTQRIA